MLVADADPANLGHAQELLCHWGITPIVAADGAEGVSLACKREFDLILMDLQMPLLDGLAVTKRIRDLEAERSAARTPVLAYTSHSVDDRLLCHFGRSLASHASAFPEAIGLASRPPRPGLDAAAQPQSLEDVTVYYARVVFATNASAAERHDDIDAAQSWIEAVRHAQPALFRLGQIVEGTPDLTVVATCDLNGWRREGADGPSR